MLYSMLCIGVQKWEKNCGFSPEKCSHCQFVAYLVTTVVQSLHLSAGLKTADGQVKYAWYEKDFCKDLTSNV